MSVPMTDPRQHKGELTLEDLLKKDRPPVNEKRATDTPLSASLDDLGGDESVLRELDLLAAENRQVLSKLGAGAKHPGGDFQVEDENIANVVKEYEELLAEKDEMLESKTETIRQIHLENQELRQQLEQAKEQAQAQAKVQPVTEDDLTAWAEELERKYQELELVRHQQEQEREESKRERQKLTAEYTQLEEDKESMERDLGRMEAELAQERVAIQRQRLELQRLFSDINREFDKLRGEGDLQKRLAGLKNLKDRQPDDAALQAKKPAQGSGLFGGLFKRKES